MNQFVFLTPERSGSEQPRWAARGANAPALRFLVLAVLAGVLGACASQSVVVVDEPAPTEPAELENRPEPVIWGQPEPEKVVETGTARPRTLAAPTTPAASAQQIEEVVVTGNRVSAPPFPRWRAAREKPRFARDPAPNDSGLPISVQPGEELWIISKLPERADADLLDGPRSGAMLAHFDDPDAPGGIRQLALPLQHTSVDARINGYVGAVDIRQRFGNPYDRKIEVVYLFPLPEKAAVTGFVMQIGERRIRGILREKEEAQRIYDAAKAQGYRASLLTQRRPNVFEQKVANIEPGKTIDVELRYFHTLAYRDGWYSFVFPAVVGPRFNPPGSADPIAAVPSGRATGDDEIPYLWPDERSGHDLSIDVRVDAGVAIEELRASHEIRRNHSSPREAAVSLAAGSTIPNRDFVLDFRVAGERVKHNLLTYQDPDSGDGYFTMMLYPPEAIERGRRQPMEMVFVLDCSGSMSGLPLAQAKAAVDVALDRLTLDDTFQIIRFSDQSSQFGTEPVRATPDRIRAARRYVRNLNGHGGTMMIEGIKSALEFPHDPGRLRFVVFLTDGYIGNEAEILAAIQPRLGGSRIFSFGVGSSVNRYLMERMAKVGRGAVAYLGPDQSGAQVMDQFFNRVSHPSLTNLHVDWGGMRVSEVYPRRLPDLFVGRPVVVTGRFEGNTDYVSVGGRLAGQDHYLQVDVSPPDPNRAELAKLWARLKIAELKDRQSITGTAMRPEILATALRHELVSDYTSFVAVDGTVRTKGAPTTVRQPVPVPAGVSFDATVSE